METPAHLRPFVVPVEIRTAERHGAVDLYIPDGARPRPAVVFVHGGPTPAQVRPTPRDWPAFQGYGSLAAARGLVGVTVDHGLHSLSDYAKAAANVAAAVETARADPRVDRGRVAIWCFSGSSLLLADWLRDPPAWLRCVAASYPILAMPPGMVEARFQPGEAVTGAGTLPIVLTRVGRERPEIAATVETFIEAAHAAGANLKIVDVPDGQHGFDVLDDNPQSREGIGQALDAVLTALT